MGLCCIVGEKGNPANSFNLGKMYGYNHPEKPNKFQSIMWLIRTCYSFYDYLYKYLKDDKGCTNFTTSELYDAAIELFTHLQGSDTTFAFNTPDDFSYMDGFVISYLIEYAKYGWLPETAEKKMQEYFEWRKRMDAEISDTMCIYFT